VIWLGAVGLIGLGAPSGSYTAPAVQAPAAQVILGESVFNTAWASAGTPGVARRGLGPLFNAASCAMCHANGGGGKGPAADGPTPTALVIQLGTTGAEVGAEEDGDPLYGRVFNTASVDGVRPEGVVIVRYRELEGRYYLDGARWRMRVPQYQLTGLTHGPLAAQTVIKPRLALALFGAGVLEGVPASVLDGAGTVTSQNQPGNARPRGRFGWQSQSVSIRDQTTKAFAREMGLTTMGSCTRWLHGRRNGLPATAERWLAGSHHGARRCRGRLRALARRAGAVRALRAGHRGGGVVRNARLYGLSPS
jgi:CxxC motif-containing protein (DUF1111 family)